MCNVIEHYRCERQYLKLTYYYWASTDFYAHCGLFVILNRFTVSQLLRLLLENVRPTFCVHRSLKLRVLSWRHHGVWDAVIGRDDGGGVDGDSAGSLKVFGFGRLMKAVGLLWLSVERRKLRVCWLYTVDWVEDIDWGDGWHYAALCGLLCEASFEIQSLNLVIGLLLWLRSVFRVGRLLWWLLWTSVESSE